MNEYLESQIALMGRLRMITRTLGLIAGVGALAIPMFALINGLTEALFVCLPIGLNFMFLAIALRNRVVELGVMLTATNDSVKFVSLLTPYLAKIRTHRVILWVVAGLIVLNSMSRITTYAFYSQMDAFSLFLGSGAVLLLSAGLHVYLGLVLSKQIKDLTPSLTA